MKKFLIALLVTLSAMAIVVSDAEARRLGGGGTFGRQSPNVTRQAPAQPSQATKPAAAPAATPATVPPKPASPWRGILGGALLGLGLGALMSHFGLGGALGGMFGTILMVGLLALVAVFIFRLFRGKNADQASQPAYAGGYPSGNTPEIGSRLEPYGQPAALQSVPLSSTSLPWGVPADFDVPGFLRNAKTYFIRLQAAWDKADINDIREFTTTEMFAELKLQIQERGASPNNTDVVSLEAELMGVETPGSEYLASVRFSGMIKEAENAPAEPFTEVWNLSKPISGSGGWLLAGIQQLS
jgi:predicted lipid-binding transport protein (Tim44 family)